MKELIDGILDDAITFACCSGQAGVIKNLHVPAAILNQPFLQQLASRQSDAVTLMPQHVGDVFLSDAEGL